ncbi:hypothetical protein C4J81_13585 [Deltaproteobacteria bacterium Smac51]|nr:hypothetical protein C4J81_13585 [Deltaproteobacteria bacterium Smac51]
MKAAAAKFWNNLSIFWKSYVLSVLLSITVITIGEGCEDLMEDFYKFLRLSGKSDKAEALAWLLAIVSSSLAGGFIFSRIITRALTCLHTMALKLAEGDLTSRMSAPEITRGDEIGYLSRMFNQMADGVVRLLDNERRLIRDLSHELRSPLSRMKMALAMLEKKVEMAPPEAAAQYIGQLEKDVERMEYMISQMLEQARLETMVEVGVEKGLIDLAAIVRESVDELEFQAREDGLEIVVEASDALPLRGNATIIKRATDNMIKNALQYTGRNGRVSVRVWPEGGDVVLEVSDEGSGVPEEMLSDIFKPFFRVDPARDRASGGFGLGLSIVDQAAQTHQGSVRASNIIKDSRRTGLRITLRLPR